MGYCTSCKIVNHRVSGKLATQFWPLSALRAQRRLAWCLSPWNIDPRRNQPHDFTILHNEDKT